MSMRRIATSGLIALALLAGCAPRRAPHPVVGQTRYTCCNIHYEKDEIVDANYQVGTLIPFGTRVQILDVRDDRIKFQADGAPPITWFVRFGKGTPIDTYLSQMFPESDPKLKLPKKLAAKTRKSMETGTVEPGMTRDQVLMTLGYPPTHRTPSLSAPSWHYWRNRWAQFDVYFEGDKVDRVQ
jgi:hypothetical protein